MAATALLGCNVFTLEPLQELDASMEGGMDDDTIQLVDTCTPEPDAMDLVTSAERERMASFAGLTDTVRNLTICGATGLTGPDGFVPFQAVAEQRWTIGAEPLDADADVALYVLPMGCDVNACEVSLDRCGPGILEQFTFQALSQGNYFLGVDTHGASMGDIELTMVTTQCGDRNRDPGEGCDDGNRMNGDGCDRNCRLELETGEISREIEPNNWPTEGNAMLSAAVATEGQATAVGRVGGACDEDYFVVTVPDGASLRATMLDGAMLPCSGGTPEVSMVLTQAATGARRGMGTSGRAGGECPSIEEGDAFAENLPGGEYYVSLAGERDIGVVDYHLVVEVVVPAAAD
jgi:cysteine-rich repeat protein